MATISAAERVLGVSWPAVRVGKLKGTKLDVTMAYDVSRHSSWASVRGSSTASPRRR